MRNEGCSPQCQSLHRYRIIVDALFPFSKNGSLDSAEAVERAKQNHARNVQRLFEAFAIVDIIVKGIFFIVNDFLFIRFFLLTIKDNKSLDLDSDLLRCANDLFSSVVSKRLHHCCHGRRFSLQSEGDIQVYLERSRLEIER